MRHRLEYALAWLIVKFLGALPRPLVRAAGISLGWIIYLLHHRLRSVGIRNLALAYPEKSRREHARILRGVFTSLGRQLAEVCLFPKYTRENIAEVVVYDGFENFERAVARGKGVLFLTGHLGGWELSAFAHSLYGHPLHVVMRALDNPYLDQLSRQYRTMHGNSMIDKDEPVRAQARLYQSSNCRAWCDIDARAGRGKDYRVLASPRAADTHITNVRTRKVPIPPDVQ